LTDSYRHEVAQLGIDVVLVQPSAYPTQMYGSSAQPVDADRVGEYGEIGEIPGAMFQQFMTLLSGPEAPNPQDIANAIADLIRRRARQKRPIQHPSDAALASAAFRSSKPQAKTGHRPCENSRRLLRVNASLEFGTCHILKA
jgi:NAD(P)-dependent dehydrogenase (short-subunit alcohol dehydrogenase family)